MGIIIGILILTGAVAWVALTAMCVYLLSELAKAKKGSSVSYHGKSALNRAPRVSKKVFQRVFSSYRSPDPSVNLEIGYKYLIIFENEPENGPVEYVCFTSADIHPVPNEPEKVKFSNSGCYKFVVVDYRSNRWVAARSI